MKTITVSSFKGGTGKTSLVLLLGNAYAAAGKRVLVIDMDHQQNATRYHATSWDDVAGKNISEAIHREDLTANILPSHIENTDFVAGSMGTVKQRTTPNKTLSRMMERVSGYDVVLIDTPPSLDAMVLNAWTAADLILTPARLDTFDYDGLETIRDLIDLEATGTPWQIVLNFHRPARSQNENNLTFNFEQAFTETYPNILPVRIPDTMAIHRAIHDGETITTAKAKQKAYSAITELAATLIDSPLQPEVF